MRSDSELERLYSAPFGAYPLSDVARKRIDRAVAAKGRWYFELMRSLARRPLRASHEIVDMDYRDCRFRLLPSENYDDMQLVAVREHPELDEIEVFEHRVAGASCFVDIGANMGIYTVFASRQLAPGGRIIAFEPHPRTLVKLRRNAELNGIEGLEIVAKAVGPQEGVAQLHVTSARNAGQNTLRALEKAEGDAVDVPVAPLLAELQARGVAQIDVLKIDVEGYESEALFPFFDTAPRSLWPSYIMLEVAHSDQWSTDLLAQLSGIGYRQVYANSANAHFALDDTPDTSED